MRLAAALLALSCLLTWVKLASAGRHPPLPMTPENFFQPGTQPDASGEQFHPIEPSLTCSFCHQLEEPREVPIYSRWRASMMANSARDPLFRACLAIANQDVSGIGELCLRCHAPAGWLGGRASPPNLPDGSAFTEDDLEGITCSFCHRLVDPVFTTKVSPRQDQPILNALISAGLLPNGSGNATYVVDPDDVRRGPFPICPDRENCESPGIPINFHGVPAFQSPFHSKSDLCGTCHEVSNPAMVRQVGGDYAPATPGTPHPTQNKRDMFPHDRTYSEWANSLYATVGVFHGKTFGGNHPTGVMRTCQDCHMPDAETFGCAFQDPPFYERPNVPSHDFNGGNTWMLNVLEIAYPDLISPEMKQGGIDRATYMLKNAATMELSDDGCYVGVRINNQTGHKLPTGYTEGRRMWLQVVFLNHAGQSVRSHGAYDEESADLAVTTTQVYEAKLGIDENMAKQVGIPAGPSFRFGFVNKVYKDNRIPPRGFTNAAFEAAQASPVGAKYADGQFWDDARFHIPQNAVKAIVRLYYQTASKEYIEFLRDANHTNSAGRDLYLLWELTDRSPPVMMNEGTLLGLIPGRRGDADCSGQVNFGDFPGFVDCLVGPVRAAAFGCEPWDWDADGDVDLVDASRLQADFNLP